MADETIYIGSMPGGPTQEFNTPPPGVSIEINKSDFNFDENFSVKIVSPNISLEEYNTQSEFSALKKLIRISDPDKSKKTLFIWPEGIFYESNLQDIKQYKNLFNEEFSKNHLIVLGVNNFVNYNNLEDKKYFNSLVILNHELEIISIYNKAI